MTMHAWVIRVMSFTSFSVAENMCELLKTLPIGNVFVTISGCYGKFLVLQLIYARSIAAAHYTW